jgi:hypothetical protein
MFEMKLSEDEIKRRMPVWQALSDLWLDTELQDNDIEYIARVSAESGYSLAELKHIYLEEVAPAVHYNMFVSAFGVGGEWGAFNSEWLKEEILKTIDRNSFFSRLPVIRNIRRGYMTLCVKEPWKQVEDILVQKYNDKGLK